MVITMIKDNLETIEKRIQNACNRVHRPRESVTLIGVSKLHPADDIREAVQTTSLRHFGENYVQEYCEKREQLTDITDAKWHVIGHLQRNKVRALLKHAPDLIHTVDSLQLAETIDRIQGELNPENAQEVLIEVRLGDEDSEKTGCPPEAVEALADHIDAMPHLRLRGLMLIPPADEDPEKTRPWFKKLSVIANNLSSKHDMSIISCGMSHDFEIAIEEGATHVRIGTAIFGARNYTP